MIEKLIQTDVTEFNKETLKKLKPYFDSNIIFSDLEERHQWFHNLLTLAQHSLGIAHCIQHNATPRLLMEVKFKNKQYPNFYDPIYENLIGCYSNFKSADEMTLDGTTVSGTKHWISMVHQADYGIFRVPVNDTEAYVLIDFATVKPSIDMSYATPMGMEIACPGSITVNNYTLPENCILGYRKYYENSPEFFHINSISDYCFITNYLGLILSLNKEVKTYIEQTKINVDFEFKKIGLVIAGLVMTWQDNLSSVDITTPTDEFWHRRNTQYTLYKDTLIDLIHLILQICDSRWLDAKSSNNQRFRDALTFCSHMKPLHRNLEEKHFVKY